MFGQPDKGLTDGGWDQVVSKLDEKVPPQTSLRSRSVEAPKQKLLWEHDISFADISLRLKALEDLQVGSRLASLEAFSLGSIDAMKEDRRVVQSIRVRVQSLEMRQELEARAAFLETKRLDGNILQLNDNLQPLKSELEGERHKEKARLEGERQKEKAKGSLTDRTWDTAGLRERVRSVERRCAAVELELNSAKFAGKWNQQRQKSPRFQADSGVTRTNVETICNSEASFGNDGIATNLLSARSTVSSVPLAFYGAHPTARSDKNSARSSYMHNIRHTQC